MRVRKAKHPPFPMTPLNRASRCVTTCLPSDPYDAFFQRLSKLRVIELRMVTCSNYVNAIAACARVAAERPTLRIAQLLSSRRPTGARTLAFLLAERANLDKTTGSFASDHAYRAYIAALLQEVGVDLVSDAWCAQK